MHAAYQWSHMERYKASLFWVWLNIGESGKESPSYYTPILATMDTIWRLSSAQINWLSTKAVESRELPSTRCQSCAHAVRSDLITRAV